MNRVGGVVVILDLGLGQRRLLDDRPQHGLGALVEPAIHQELRQLAHDHGLGLVGHGRVVVIPVAVDAQALELLALHADPVIGEGAALAAELADRHGVLVLVAGAILLLDLPFDRQAVAVPARHVVAVLAQHLLGAAHQVLQDLVERVADMEVAVGVGRAVMQHELGPALALGAQALEQAHVGPALQQLRLLLGQPGAHGEVGLGQKDAGFIVGCHEQLGAKGAMGGRRIRRSRTGTTRPRSADRADNSLLRGPDKHRPRNLWTRVRGVKEWPAAGSLSLLGMISAISAISATSFAGLASASKRRDTILRLRAFRRPGILAHRNRRPEIGKAGQSGYLRGSRSQTATCRTLS